MKGVTGRFFRKLKSISTITTLRQGVVVHASTVQKGPPDETSNYPKDPFPGRISLSERLKNEGQDEENDATFYDCWKESPLESASTNSGTIPFAMEKSSKQVETTELQPNPFELMVKEHESTVKSKEREARADQEREEFPALLSWKDNFPADEESEEEHPTLLDFEENCPPEGNERVILYTTSLKGIRKTFEDCNSVKFLLESFKVVYIERDISMHLEFREELWRTMGSRVAPPQLFIKGRHIGGAEEVLRLHEQGRLRRLFRGIPVNLSGCPCGGCGGLRFVVCSRCNGSRKVIPADESTGEWTWIRCLECNNNGLVKCPICS